MKTKYTLTLIALFTIIGGINAQFAQEGTRWIYHFNTFGWDSNPKTQSYKEVISLKDDTLWEGRTASYLNHLFGCIYGSRFVANSADNDTVFFWDKHALEYKVLYNFRADVGDEWKYEKPLNSELYLGDSIKTKVIEKQDTVINGELLRLYKCEYSTIYDHQPEQGWIVYKKSTVIERFGDVNYMFGFDNFHHEGCEEYYLGGFRCFYDPLLDWVKLDTITDCYEEKVIIGVSEPKVSALSVFPNPSTDIIYFKVNNQHPVYYTLKDITGKQVFSGLLQNDYLSIAHLPNGVYLLQLTENGNLIHYSKVVKM